MSYSSNRMGKSEWFFGVVWHTSCCFLFLKNLTHTYNTSQDFTKKYLIIVPLPMSIDTSFQKILWEYDLSGMDYTSEILAERVLSLWEQDLLDFWMIQVGSENSKRLFLKVASRLDAKSLSYWNLFFWTDISWDSNRTMYEQLNVPVFFRSFGSEPTGYITKAKILPR